MKALNILFIILFSTFSFSQNFKLEENPNWKKFKKVTELNFENNSKTEYFLENGKIINTKNFINDSLTETSSINENIQDSINQIYNSDNLLEFDGEFNYFYNEKKQLIEIRNFGNLFNSTYYIYNQEGMISKITSSYFHPSRGKWYRNLTEFEYDKCGNIIQEKDKEFEVKKPLSELPENYFANANIKKFFYKYKNKNCIWTEKYEIINEKKKLLKKRILK